MQKADAVADVLHFLLIMTGQNGNQSAVAGFLTENSLETLPHDGIQTIKGFVAQENSRIAGQTKTNLSPFLSALGKAGDAFMQRQQEAQAQLCQFVLAVIGIKGCLETRHFRYGGVHQKGGLVAEITDRLFAEGRFQHRSVIQRNLSVIGTVQPGKDAKKRGFPGTISAQQTKNMAGFQRKTDIIEGNSCTKVFANMVGFQQEDPSLYTLLVSA